MEIEIEIFDYLDRIREDRGIEAKTLAPKIWPDKTPGSAAATYSRMRKEHQKMSLGDLDTLCTLLEVDLVSVVFRIKERMRLESEKDNAGIAPAGDDLKSLQ